MENKKILIIGSGGREHAIIRKFNESNVIETIYVTPGNPGMKKDAVVLGKMSNIEIINFYKAEEISFIFVGPEQPLSEGFVDLCQRENIRVIGPTKKAAQIESSKIFAKNLMKKYNVPTADYHIFDNFEKAKNFLNSCKYPQVLKADGLAAGKGVSIVQNYSEAISELNKIMVDEKFGSAGSKIVIEEFMEGWEASIFAFCDGENFVSTIFPQDHKRAYDGDKGENTGGMGAYAPVLKANKYKKFVDDNIFSPILKALKEENSPFSGILFAGLMFTKEGPKVVEFNCRFGDPETEVILPLLKTDLYEISEAIISHNIDKIKLEWKDKFAVTVVAASKGYPGKYEKSKEIFVNFEEDEKCFINFAGVKEKQGKILTNGGRVLMLTAIDKSIEKTIRKAYKNMEKISFDGMFFRKDIAKQALIK